MRGGGQDVNLQNNNGEERVKVARHAFAATIYESYLRRVCPDIILRAFGNEYPAHRVILASGCEFFARALGPDWRRHYGMPGGADSVTITDPAGVPYHDLVLGEDVTQTGWCMLAVCFSWCLGARHFSMSCHRAATAAVREVFQNSNCSKTHRAQHSALCTGLCLPLKLHCAACLSRPSGVGRRGVGPLPRGEQATGDPTAQPAKLLVLASHHVQMGADGSTIWPVLQPRRNTAGRLPPPQSLFAHHPQPVSPRVSTPSDHTTPASARWSTRLDSQHAPSPSSGPEPVPQGVSPPPPPAAQVHNTRAWLPRVPPACPPGFEWLLEYLYGSPRLDLAPDNALHVLAAAHYLGAAEVEAAAVGYLAARLSPANFSACLAWATRLEQGPASQTLAAACRTLLALRLPRDLDAWAPALPYIDDATLYDILSSDWLAVRGEYERYCVVRRVAGVLLRAADEAEAEGEREAAGSGGQAAEAMAAAQGSGDGGCSCVSCCHVQRVLCDALNMDGADAAAAAAGSGGAGLGPSRGAAWGAGGGGAARQLRLARSCPSVLTPGQAAADGARGSVCGSDRGSSCAPGSSASSGACRSAGVQSVPGLPASRGSSSSLGAPAAAAVASEPLASPGRDAGQGAGGGSEVAGADGGAAAVAAVASEPPARCRSLDLPRGSGAAGGPAGGRNLAAIINKAVTAAATSAATTAAAGVCTLPLTPARSSSGPLPPPADFSPAGPTDPLHDRHHPSVTDTAAVSSTPSAVPSPAVSNAACTAAALRACASALLCGGVVRYEHLPHPQLAAVAAEGAVPQHVLREAAWRRAELECVLVRRAGGAGGEAEAQAEDEDASSIGAPAAPGRQLGLEPLGAAAGDGREGEAPLRPFRLCWRVPAAALRSLAPGDCLCSPLHVGYAGAAWQLRLVRSGGGGGGGGGGFGVYVGRIVPAAAAATAAPQRHPRPGPQPAPRQQQQPPRAAPQQQQQQYQRRQRGWGRRAGGRAPSPPPPPLHPVAPEQRPGPRGGARGPSPPPPANAVLGPRRPRNYRQQQQRQQAHHRQQQLVVRGDQDAAAGGDGGAGAGGGDGDKDVDARMALALLPSGLLRQGPLRCRYRIAVLQPDTRALGGRTALADTDTLAAAAGREAGEADTDNEEGAATTGEAWEAGQAGNEAKGGGQLRCEAAFTAGAFHGRGGLLAAADVAGLGEGGEVLVCVALQVVV